MIDTSHSSARPVTRPPTADCRCILQDGRVLTVTATRRPRANRAEVKCVAPGAPALGERMLEVVRLARLTEHRFDSREQVVISMDIEPQHEDRSWELAAVLADRMVRELWAAPVPPVTAMGWSDAWHLGRIDGGPSAAQPQAGTMLLGGLGQLSHLGALTGHADPSSAVSSVRSWFPLHSGGVNDTLCWVEASVYPLEGAEKEEDTIAAPGLDAATQLAVRQTLAEARHFDGQALGRWRTVVRFGEPRFQGNSYQLALVMADRLARGRDFVPRGRLIATGASSAWHAGRVDAVEGRAPKLELIERQARKGDRVLLPLAWQAETAEAFGEGLRAKGVSLAWIERIGLI
ncbi:hypothetical protein [Massilia endophytica]|uniref:hypothetical protein n=1 Tax=Massilia endophytica TaxID=2899220 RepID=UPI001E5E12A5|nr:hypothetical protein [Massilia endophytica]UGQ48309.1 hypothetical protein LSQ66_07540 [Massilia endophytica]